MFHVGHLNILEKSAALGDELIVGVSTDELIEQYKGMKPVIPFEQRFRIISSLKCVTKVVKQVKLTEIAQLKREQIDIVTIGDDWEHKYLEGLEWMKSQPDKKVVYFPYTPGVSKTSIKKCIIEWFTNAINRAPNGLAIIKMMYDLLLAGDGLGVIGASKGYKSRFKAFLS